MAAIVYEIIEKKTRERKYYFDPRTTSFFGDGDIIQNYCNSEG